MSEQLPRVLVKVRDELGVSRKRAAELLKVSRMTYEMWERGNWMPRFENVPELARFTGKDEEVILGYMGLLTPEAVRILSEARDSGNLRRVVPHQTPD